MYSERDTFSVTAFDSEKENGQYPKVTLTKDNIADFLSKGSKCETILQCSGLWVVDQKFGISWVVVQMKIYKNENKLIGYSFEDELETEDLDEDFTVEKLELEEDDDVEEVQEVEVKERKPRRKREYL